MPMKWISLEVALQIENDRGRRRDDTPQEKEGQRTLPPTPSRWSRRKMWLMVRKIVLVLAGLAALGRLIRELWELFHG